MPEYPRTLATITPRDPPPTLKTLADWRLWIAEENLRMALEAYATLSAILEREAGDQVLH